MIINIPDFPTAFVAAAFRSAAPDGWLLLNGQTIGNQFSGASARASADTESLFLTLWNDTNASVVGGRGDTAAADYAANKELVLPNAGGRALAGADPTGSILSESTIPGIELGLQSTQLIMAEVPQHQHGIGGTQTFDTNGGGSTATGITSTETGPATGELVSAQSHNNVQPTLICHWMIKL
jgi:microcystin-dependent protein